MKSSLFSPVPVGKILLLQWSAILSWIKLFHPHLVPINWEILFSRIFMTNYRSSRVLLQGECEMNKGLLVFFLLVILWALPVNVWQQFNNNRIHIWIFGKTGPFLPNFLCKYVLLCKLTLHQTKCSHSYPKLSTVTSLLALFPTF